MRTWRGSGRSGLFRPFVVGGLAVFVAAGIGMSALMSFDVRGREEANATLRARLLADGVVAPLMAPQDLAGAVTGPRYEELKRLIHERLPPLGKVLLVKVWSPNGMVVYSDEQALVGRTFAEERETLRQVMAGETETGVSNLEESENVIERTLADQLFETYVPLRLDPGGPVVGVVEIYQDYSVIDAQVGRVFRAMALSLSGGLILLYVALLPIAIRPLRRQNARLGEAEARYRTLVEQLPAVVYIDSNEPVSTTLYISPQVESILGYAPGDLIGDPARWRGVIHPEDSDREQHAEIRAYESKRPYSIEYRVVARDGRVLWLNDQSAPVRGQSGEILFWQGVMLDITDLKRAGEDLARSARALEESNQQLEHQRAELATALEELGRAQAHRRALLDRTVAGAEEERQRLARELHDGPIQHLTALDYRLERVRRDLGRGGTEAVDELVHRTQEALREEIKEIRQMMSALRPPVLDERGLEAAIRDHADALRRESGIEFDVRSNLDRRLDSALETVLYRVAQEALRNVVKHARAEHGWVLLAGNNGSIVLEVGDDGIGLDTGVVAERAAEGHFGLASMRERVETIGGTWEVRARPDGGTIVRAVLNVAGMDRSA